MAQQFPDPRPKRPTVKHKKTKKGKPTRAKGVKHLKIRTNVRGSL